MGLWSLLSAGSLIRGDGSGQRADVDVVDVGPLRGVERAAARDEIQHPRTGRADERVQVDAAVLVAERDALHPPPGHFAVLVGGVDDVAGRELPDVAQSPG